MRFIIEDHKSIFEECHSVYSKRTSIKDSRKVVCDLLMDLNYRPDDKHSDNSDKLIRDRNRSALLRLASRLDKVFELPLPHAPGAKFIGGMVSAKSDGIEGHGTVGVGGRGVSFQTAFQSCIGEAAEYLSFTEREDDVLLCSQPFEHNLSEGALKWALAGIGLSQLESYDRFDWIEAKSLKENEPAWFPSCLVLRQLPSKNLTGTKSESTGVSAGVNLETACESGLLEVIERDAIALWWYGERPAIRFDQRFLQSIGFLKFAEDIRGESDRNFWLLDLTTEFEIPVVGAFSANSDGSVVVAGFSGGFHLLDAMKRALLEMCQMELAQEISLSKHQRMNPEDLGEQDWIWVRRYNELSIENYPRLLGDSLGVKTDNVLEKLNMELVFDCLQQHNFQPYFVNLTRPEIEIPVVKVLIPGLQSANPTWLSQRLIEVSNKHHAKLDFSIKNVSPI